MRDDGWTRSWTALVALVVSLAVTGAAWSASAPPTDLKLVGDHWTAWNPPEAGPGAYRIQQGDTLWDLAGQWLGDPFLWPQVWDENRYILDSHWIYPGDPLVVPGQPEVVPATGPLPGTERTPPPVEKLDEGRPAGPAPTLVGSLVPVADDSDVYCSGFIVPEPEVSLLSIVGTDTDRRALATGDVVHLNRGRDAGIRAGEEYMVLRRTSGVAHPESGESLGTYVRRLGRVRVMLSHESSATAVIEMACSDIRSGDELLPWTDIPIPRLPFTREFDPYAYITEGSGPDGHIVSVRDDHRYVGAGHIIHTDLGNTSGARAGQVLTLFRENGDMPRTVLGRAVILTVEPLTSTAKITHTVRETEVGDRVEVYR